MNDPCENLSYEAKIHLSFEIDGLNFTSDLKYEFEVASFPGLSKDELCLTAKASFKNEHIDIILDLDVEVSVESVNKI